VVASFRLQHYGLCPTCQGRTRADIAKAYGQSHIAGESLSPEKGSWL